MKIGTWLLSMCEPLLARILLSLGFSVVTITGMGIVFNQVKTQMVTAFGGLPGAGLNLFLLAGGGIALGIITGAIATRLTITQVQNAVQIRGKSNG
ncbi:MAG: DUF2523 domain-containing protein [Pseudomonadota bacterium]